MPKIPNGTYTTMFRAASFGDTSNGAQMRGPSGAHEPMLAAMIIFLRSASGVFRYAAIQCASFRSQSEAIGTVGDGAPLEGLAVEP